MNTRSISINSIQTFFINRVHKFLLQTLLCILRPFVQFIYSRYCIYKRKKNPMKSNMVRNAVFTSTVFALGIAIAFSAGIFVKNVQAEDYDILHKYYTSVTVQPGDSLWLYAQEYYVMGYNTPSDYIEEIMQINHINNEDEIICGTVLVIPYYSEEIK